MLSAFNIRKISTSTSSAWIKPVVTFCPRFFSPIFPCVCPLALAMSRFVAFVTSIVPKVVITGIMIFAFTSIALFLRRRGFIFIFICFTCLLTVLLVDRNSSTIPLSQLLHTPVHSIENANCTAAVAVTTFLWFDNNPGVGESLGFTCSFPMVLTHHAILCHSPNIFHWNCHT